MQEEIKAMSKNGGEANPGCNEVPEKAADSTKPEEKRIISCRDRCMHCGNHCVYLNTKQEEE